LRLGSAVSLLLRPEKRCGRGASRNKHVRRDVTEEIADYAAKLAVSTVLAESLSAGLLHQTRISLMADLNRAEHPAVREVRATRVLAPCTLQPDPVEVLISVGQHSDVISVDVETADLLEL